MLPQCAYAYVCILKENWPELGIVGLCRVMLGYNYYHKDLCKAKQTIHEKMGKGDEEDEEDTRLSDGEWEEK